MNHEQLQRAMQANYVEYFRPFQVLPKAIWYEDEQVTWILPQGAPGNHVLRANFSAETLQTDLDTLFKTLDQHTMMVRWLVYDHDQPSNLADALGLRELTVSQGEPCMVRALNDLPPMPNIDGLEIVLVSNDAQLDDWRVATGAGFGGGYDFSARWAEPYRQHGLGSDSNFLHYVGYVNGTPATSSSMVLGGGIAGMYDISTAPAFRKRGLGFAITLAQLREAQRRGYSHAYLRSSRQGQPVYERLGFKVACYEQEYLWRSPRLINHGSD